MQNGQTTINRHCVPQKKIVKLSLTDANKQPAALQNKASPAAKGQHHPK